MKQWLLSLMLILPIAAFSQTEPAQDMNSRYYRFKNTIRVDSGFVNGRQDTTNIRPSLLAPGYMVWRPQDQRLYLRDSTKFRGFAFLDEIPSVAGYLTFSTKMTPLVTELNLPIQPTDSLTQSLGKLQAQINYQYGSFFKYNELNAAQLIIQNPRASRSIIVQRYGLGGVGDTTSAVVGFRTGGGRDISYIGLAVNLPGDTNTMHIFNGVGRLIATNSDSTAYINATWDGSNLKYYSFLKQGKLRLYNTSLSSIWNDPVHHSTLEVKGSFSLNIRTVTGNTTATDEDGTIVVINTGSATVSLPSAASVAGRIHTIVKISAAANDVIIDPNGAELINGQPTKTLTLQWSSVTIQSNGVSWIIISSHANATTL